VVKDERKEKIEEEFKLELTASEIFGQIFNFSKNCFNFVNFNKNFFQFQKKNSKKL
jgi:hypothetical protein